MISFSRIVWYEWYVFVFILILIPHCLPHLPYLFHCCLKTQSLIVSLLLQIRNMNKYERWFRLWYPFKNVEIELNLSRSSRWYHSYWEFSRRSVTQFLISLLFFDSNRMCILCRYPLSFHYHFTHFTKLLFFHFFLLIFFSNFSIFFPKFPLKTWKSRKHFENRVTPRHHNTFNCEHGEPAARCTKKCVRTQEKRMLSGSRRREHPERPGRDDKIQDTNRCSHFMNEFRPSFYCLLSTSLSVSCSCSYRPYHPPGLVNPVL